MMVGLEFPQVIREGRIEEWALSQSKSAELLLLACCMTQTDRQTLIRQKVTLYGVFQQTAAVSRVRCQSYFFYKVVQI